MHLVSERIAGRTRRAVTCAAALLVVAACSGPEALPPPTGHALYERSVGGLACADCHGVQGRPSHDDWILPGRSLVGVASRDSFWNGRFKGDSALEDATRLCAARFQYRMLEDLLENDAPDWSDVPLSSDELSALTGVVRGLPGKPTMEPWPRRVDDLDAAFDLDGDPERGEVVWKAACAVCHGSNAEGGLGPRLRGVDSVDAFTLMDYVRQGAGDMEPFAWMPHFPPSVLSAQDLADLAARYAE